jgi:hypothetical protein
MRIASSCVSLPGTWNRTNASSTSAAALAANALKLSLLSASAWSITPFATTE